MKYRCEHFPLKCKLSASYTLMVGRHAWGRYCWQHVDTAYAIVRSLLATVPKIRVSVRKRGL